MLLKQITFIATVTNRINCLFSLVISIRKVFGSTCKIIITIQDDILPQDVINFLNENDVQYVLTGYDTGLSYNRNFLVGMVRTKYFVICDDDFIFYKSSGLIDCVELMEQKNLNILGGIYKTLYLMVAIDWFVMRKINSLSF